MVVISRELYNGSYSMTAKPIKSLELHYTMIEFLINRDKNESKGCDMFGKQEQDANEKAKFLSGHVGESDERSAHIRWR